MIRDEVRARAEIRTGGLDADHPYRFVDACRRQVPDHGVHDDVVGGVAAVRPIERQPQLGAVLLRKEAGNV